MLTEADRERASALVFEAATIATTAKWVERIFEWTSDPTWTLDQKLRHFRWLLTLNGLTNEDRGRIENTITKLDPPTQ